LIGGFEKSQKKQNLLSFLRFLAADSISFIIIGIQIKWLPASSKPERAP
jgi:hypothetical protein